MATPQDLSKITEENSKLKREIEALKEQHERERQQLEQQAAAEKTVADREAEVVKQRTGELESLKTQMVRLTRKLDDEVSARDQVQLEQSKLERQLQQISLGGSGTSVSSSKDKVSAAEDEVSMRERGSSVSTKLMRVVDQWMRHKDLQQALLRNAAINDSAFTTLAQALVDCPSLQTLDLSQNLLTMDSCSDLCQLITTAPSLSFMSLAENLFSLRSVGYFMTAIMERQTTKRLVPLDLLDLQGNEGMQMAIAAPAPEAALKMLKDAAEGSLGGAALQTAPALTLVGQVMRALWRFLMDTGHPQVRASAADEMAFDKLDQVTLRKMDSALMKILLMGVSEDKAIGGEARPVTANLTLIPALNGKAKEMPRAQAPKGEDGKRKPERPTSAGYGRSIQPSPAGARKTVGGYENSALPVSREGRKPAAMASDPFADLKTAFEPTKEKLKTFNLKQIVTRNGTVLMNMLERLLETTEIDAVDVESDQTLLEYACLTGNMGLAKLCYRRGANLSARTKKGETAFNIVTKSKRYDLMEFLHTYGVKVNSADADGRCALHVASANDDVDGICRLLEWGADVNIRDNKMRTPIHVAAAGGKAHATMLLLEVGADMNAKDNREYTAVAHAEANNHFQLMDRLVQLGGKGHGLQSKGLAASKSTGSLKGSDMLAVPAGVLKSSSLGRIGKVAVKGMPGPILPQLVKS